MRDARDRSMWLNLGEANQQRLSFSKNDDDDVVKLYRRLLRSYTNTPRQTLNYNQYDSRLQLSKSPAQYVSPK